jgi:hypothetical protein
MTERQDLAKRLDRHANKLPQLHQAVTRSANEAQHAVVSGRIDELARLSEVMKAAAQTYNEEVEQSVRDLRTAQLAVKAEATMARARGVPFDPVHPAEKLAIRTGKDHLLPADLANDLRLVSDALRMLDEREGEFDNFQREIQMALESYEVERERFARLRKPLPADVVEREAGICVRFDDPQNHPRPELLGEVRAFADEIRQRADVMLNDLVDAGHREITSIRERLASLHWSEPETLQADLKRLNAHMKTGSEREELLEGLRALRSAYEAELGLARSRLNEKIGRIVENAREVIADIPENCPEAQAVMATIVHREDCPEPQLDAFGDELSALTDEARRWALNSLARYEGLLEDERDVVARDDARVAQIGSAIVAVADRPEEFSGHLWNVGGDLLLRMVVAGEDSRAQWVYGSYGIPAVARALEAALTDQKLPQVLSLFGSEFLPPSGRSKSDSIQMLLTQPDIQRLFQEAAKSGRMRMDLTALNTLREEHLEHLLVLLERADELALPREVRLQWSAVLMQRVSSTGRMNCRALRAFLIALERSGQTLSLHYALQVFAPACPDLLDEGWLRPAFRQVIGLGLTLGDDGRRFLQEVYVSAVWTRIASVDRDLQFLRTCLAQHLVIRFITAEWLTDAWTAWEGLDAEYPVLSDVMCRQLAGERFGIDAIVDMDDLRKKYAELMTLLPDWLTSPPYRGVGLAREIDRWYVREYMQRWLQQLKLKSMNSDALDALEREMVELRALDDLVDHCPLQREPPGEFRRPVDGRVKEQLNNRLYSLIGNLLEAARMKRQLENPTTGSTVPGEALRAELVNICHRSEVLQWAVAKLLQPCLPFVEKLLCDEAN